MPTCKAEQSCDKFLDCKKAERRVQTKPGNVNQSHEDFADFEVGSRGACLEASQGKA